MKNPYSNNMPLPDGRIYPEENGSAEDILGTQYNGSLYRSRNVDEKESIPHKHTESCAGEDTPALFLYAPRGKDKTVIAIRNE